MREEDDKNDAELSQDERTEEFLHLLNKHERTLSVYVTGLVQPLQDAQDILQDGKIVMWRNFGNFTEGTNFLAWARKILLHQIFAYRRRAKKHQHAEFNEDILLMLDAEMDSEMLEKKWINRELALKNCLAKLKPEHREIMEMRYRDEVSIEKISGTSGRSDTAVYQLLFRIRKALFDCVKMELDESKT